MIRTTGTSGRLLALTCLTSSIWAIHAVAAGPVLVELGRGTPGYTFPAQDGYVVTDVDQDGLADFVYVAYAGTQSSELMVAGLRSDGSFGIKQSLSIPGAAARLAPPIDLVVERIHVVDAVSGRVHVFADWPLKEVSGFDTHPTVAKVALMDADRDGKAELLAYTFGADGALRSYDAESGTLHWRTALPFIGVSSFAPATQSDGRPAILVSFGEPIPSHWLDAATGNMLDPPPSLSATFLTLGSFGESRTPLLVIGGGQGAPLRVLRNGPPWTFHWKYQPPQGTGALLPAPLNAEAGDEIVIGDLRFPSALRVIDPNTRTESWNFPTADTSIYGLGAGDVDGDGVKEIAFGVQSPQEAWIASRLRWIDAKSHVEKWRIESQVGRFDVVALGDLDGDGRLEQVVSGEFNPIGKTYIVDTATGASIWESPNPPESILPSMTVTSVAIGEIRPGLPDVVIGGDSDMTGRLTVIDGRSHEVRLSIAGLPGHALEGRRIESLVVFDYDGDGIGDIAAATSYRFEGIRDPRVSVFSGVDGSLLAHSGQINSMPYRARSLFLGDTDTDGVPELILVAENRIQVFDTAALTPRSTFIVDSIGGRWVPGAVSGAQILVFRSDGAIEFRDALTLALRRSIAVPAPLAAVDVLDPSGARLVALAGAHLHIVGGTTGEILASSTVLGDVTGSFSTPLAVEAIGDESWQVAGGTDAGYFRFRVDVGDALFEDGFETR